MKKLLTMLVLTGSVLLSSTAMAGTSYQVRIYCKGQQMFEAVITASAAGQAQNIAVRQNPGCRAVVLGRAK